MKADKPCRAHALLLYKDSESYSYDNIITILNQADSCEYVGIYHDKDKAEEDDEQKKPHVHILVYLPFKMTNKTLAENLGIECRWVQSVQDIEAFEAYLIHLNHWNKYQYSVQELFGTRAEKTIYRLLRIKNNVTRETDSLNEVIQYMMTWISQEPFILNMTDIITEMHINGWDGHCIRAWKILEALVFSHNNEIQPYTPIKKEDMQNYGN